MKANEPIRRLKESQFRIGNFISHDNCPIFRIDEIRIDKYDGYVARMYPKLGGHYFNQFDSWIDLPLNVAKPIILTEEIVRDWFGFNKAKRCEEGLTRYGIDLVFIDNEEIYVNRTGTRIRYVHQLQNFIHAVSGTEPEVKLPNQ